MTVIALATFVVKTHHANAIKHINRAVFVAVFCRWHRRRYFPHHHFKNGTLSRDVFEACDQLGSHVGYYANISYFVKPSRIWVWRVIFLN